MMNESLLVSYHKKYEKQQIIKTKIRNFLDDVCLFRKFPLELQDLTKDELHKFAALLVEDEDYRLEEFDNICYDKDAGKSLAKAFNRGDAISLVEFSNKFMSSLLKHYERRMENIIGEHCQDKLDNYNAS